MNAVCTHIVCACEISDGTPSSSATDTARRAVAIISSTHPVSSVPSAKAPMPRANVSDISVCTSTGGASAASSTAWLSSSAARVK